MERNERNGRNGDDWSKWACGMEQWESGGSTVVLGVHFVVVYFPYLWFFDYFRTFAAKPGTVEYGRLEQ